MTGQQQLITTLTSSDTSILITEKGYGIVDVKAQGAGVNPFAARTVAEIAAGITPTNLAYPEGDIRRYGAIGAGEDNTAHINSVLAVSSKSGRPAFLAGLNLTSTGGHIRDVGTVAVDGLGAVIDFSGMASDGTAWTDTCTTGSGSTKNAQHARHPMMNLVAVGQNTGTTVGLSITDPSEPAASFLNYHNVVFEQFKTALLIGDNAYILKFFGCYFCRSATGLSIPQAINNSAEQIYFSGGGFTDCSSIAIDNQNANTTLVLEGCSIDGNNITYIHQAHNPRTYLKGCHIECLNVAAQSVPMFDIQGGCLTLDSTDIMADGSPPGPMASVFSIASGARVVIEGQPLINNLQNSGGVLCAGAGNINILSPIKTFDPTALPPIIGVEANFNLLSDGGFEQTSIKDNISIVGDVSSAITFTSGATSTVNWNPHRQALSQPIAFSTTGALPAGLVAGRTYYVAGTVATGTFQFAESPGGTPIVLADSGSGTQTCFAVVTSRAVGSHIALSTSTAQFHSGARSLAAVLNGGLGATYVVIVPCRPGQYVSAQGWYRGESAQAVALSLTNGFASDIAYGAGGVPVLIGGALQTGVNPSSVPTAWTKFNTPLVLAPSWAKYYYLNVNLNTLFNNTFYVDDLVINGY